MHATLSEPWADAVATNVDAPMAVLTSTAASRREECRCHLLRALWAPVPSANFAIFAVLMVTSQNASALDAVEARCHTSIVRAKGDSPSRLRRASTPGTCSQTTKVP